MNWYKKIKLAQIWNIESDNSLEAEIERLYELEYKYTMLRDSEFSGLPQRKYNILQKLEEALIDASQKVKKPILEVFDKWLQQHALLDPVSWASSRVELDDDVYEQEPSMAFESMIDEYRRYKYNKGSWRGDNKADIDTIFSNMLNEAINNIKNYPSLQEIANLYLEGEKENMREELYSGGGGTDAIEFFNNINNTSFTTTEEADNYIDNLDSNSINLVNYMYSEGTENFINTIEQYSSTSFDQLLFEFYSNMVFPVWLNYWKEEGIEETREAVEKIYVGLQQPNDMGREYAFIVQALNAVHQTGDMTDYLDNHHISGGDLRTTLKALSDGKDIPKWNKELKAIGVGFNLGDLVKQV